MRVLHLPPSLGLIVGRSATLALAVLMLGSSGAGAAPPATVAGETGEFEFGFKDRFKAAVICAYATGTDPLELDAFRVRGPRVQWLDSHPLDEGTVGWRVIVRTGPTRSGPWTVVRKTGARNKVARKDVNRSFGDRTVGWAGSPSKVFVRLTSRLVWRNEDGGVIGWVRHTYVKHALAETTGGTPEFGDHPTRRGDCPSVRDGQG